MRFSGVSYILALILALIIGWLEYKNTGSFVSSYHVIPVIFAVLGYQFSPQLDWWWIKKFPPKLDPVVKKLFETVSPYYRGLSNDKKALFDSRVSQYIEAKDWTLMGAEEGMPYDIKATIAFEPVRMTLSHKDFLMEPFDRIVIYPYPFLSPQHMDRYHGSEIYPMDGIAIFSLKHVMASFREPEKYFNVVLYEFARIFRMTARNVEFPIVTEDFFYNLYQVASYGHREIMGAIGLPEIDPFAVAVHHYFTYGPYFRDIYPELYAKLDIIFNTYPLGSINSPALPYGTPMPGLDTESDDPTQS